jgi:hypothetical protein
MAMKNINMVVFMINVGGNKSIRKVKDKGKKRCGEDLEGDKDSEAGASPERSAAL